MLEIRCNVVTYYTDYITLIANVGLDNFFWVQYLQPLLYLLI